MRTLIPLIALSLACNNGTTDDKDTDDTDGTEDTEVVDTEDTDDAVTDCLVADPPTNLALVSDAFPGHAAPAAWVEPNGCAATVKYEAALGTTEGGTDVIGWTDLGTALEWSTEARLEEGQDYYISVRATDAEDNVSSDVFTPPFQVWTPAALTTGPVLWLDARTGLYSDSACTTAITDGEDIGCWMDRSGHDNHAEPALGPARGIEVPVLDVPVPPSFEEDGWTTTTPAVDFRGGRAMIIEDDDTLDLSANFSIFVVNDYQPLAAALGRPSVVDYPINKEVSWEVGYYNGVFSAAVWTDQPWGWGSTTRTQNRGKHLEVFQHADTIWHFRSDGLLDASIPPTRGTGVPIANTERVTLGGREDNQTRLYSALMAEILVVDGPLTDDELDHVETYLMQRWEIAEGTPVPMDTGPIF